MREAHLFVVLPILGGGFIFTYDIYEMQLPWTNVAIFFYFFIYLYPSFHRHRGGVSPREGVF